MSDPEDLRTVTRSVPWRDLVPMSRREGIGECLLPLPWLAGAIGFAAIAWWPAALVCEFMFFLVALRVNHEAIHQNLGFDGMGHRLVLHGLSLLMLGSNHSVAFNHLRHHAHINTPRDLEGKCGRMSLAGVLAYGPLFPIECHRETWMRGDAAWRQRLVIDLALNLVLPAIALVTAWRPLVFHVATLLAAQCFTALFAVWITHHGCEHGLIARTQRNRWINFAAYNMFFHLEHHLFPSVPVRRLPQLAVRLDAAAPWIGKRAGRVIGRGPAEDEQAIAHEAPLA